MLKTLTRLLPLLLLLFTAACGTFQMQVITNPTAIPSPTPLPPEVTPAFASPQLCGGFPYETSLPADPDDPHSYIGHHYNDLDLPAGLEFNAGGVITEDLLWQWVSRPGFDMQFLSKINCRNQDGSPYNTVMDAIWIPRPEGHYDRTGLCAPLPDASPVIVFGIYNPNQPPEVLNGIAGWKMFGLNFGQRVNLETLKFEPLPLEKLECIYIVSGLGS